MNLGLFQSPKKHLYIKLWWKCPFHIQVSLFSHLWFKILQIKLASVKLAMKYMKRVSAELETDGSGSPEEEELIVQCVRFAFRVHQVKLFISIRKLRNLVISYCYCWLWKVACCLPVCWWFWCGNNEGVPRAERKSQIMPCTLPKPATTEIYMQVYYTVLIIICSKLSFRTATSFWCKDTSWLWI